MATFPLQVPGWARITRVPVGPLTRKLVSSWKALPLAGVVQLPSVLNQTMLTSTSVTTAGPPKSVGEKFTAGSVVA